MDCPILDNDAEREISEFFTLEYFLSNRRLFWKSIAEIVDCAEKKLLPEERNVVTLKRIVKKIYKTFLKTYKILVKNYPELETDLPKDITNDIKENDKKKDENKDINNDL